MKRRKRSRDIVSNLAWSGRFSSGLIGWRLPRYVTGFPAGLDESVDGLPEYLRDGQKFYRVRVTVEVVRDSLGRPITRTYKAKGGGCFGGAAKELADLRARACRVIWWVCTGKLSGATTQMPETGFGFAGEPLDFFESTKSETTSNFTA